MNPRSNGGRTLNRRRGKHRAEGVGRATNTTVVHACIAILISNFFLTLLLNALLT